MPFTRTSRPEVQEHHEKLLLFTLLCTASAFPLSQTARADDDKPLKADPKVQSVLDTMLGAIQDDSYTGFIATGDDNFKTALTKPLFESVVKQISPRENGGYEATYFGTMKKQGFTVHLWKLVFKDGGDDVLANMSLKDGKVVGFFLM